MRCTLVDTGPLVALLDERDALHSRALSELGAAPVPRFVSLPILTEAMHLLPGNGYANRIRAMFERQVLHLPAATSTQALSMKSLEWMEHYDSHSPDFADAHLIAWYEAEPGSRIWSFDSEFRTIWRTSKGKRLRLVGSK